MEGLFLEPQYLPVMGSLILGGILLATVIGAVGYSWIRREARPAREEREPLKKAA